MHIVNAGRDAGTIPPIETGPLPCTGARARRLTRRLTSFYESHLRAVDLRLSQYSVLMHLDERPQSMGELAARLEMDRTTLTRSLVPLLERGWVDAVAGADARQRCYVVTSEGQRFRARARRHWKRAQLALEAQLGRAFVAALNESLEQALERLKPGLPEDN